MLVVDFSRYLPGAFASRELLELGARVVCVEPPGGDPMRSSAPAWDAALREGKESLEVDLKRDAAPALELLREADVVLESFRPGVASRLGIGPEHAPERAVYCSINGFGLGGRHEQRAGAAPHDMGPVHLRCTGSHAHRLPGVVHPADSSTSIVNDIDDARRRVGASPPAQVR
jgi:crotonobetainyl-CoA:carnitine CoA-transferase CaiB-like acyl-CoA transferase